MIRARRPVINKNRGRRRPRFGSVVILVATAFCIGCSQGESHHKTVPAGGKVSYKGEPVKLGRVSLMPISAAEGYAKTPASGEIQPDGTFQLTTYETNDGAVPGEYQVAIISMSGGPSPEEPDAKEEWHVPQKYGSPGESGLTATIPADSSEPVKLEFTLKD